MAEQIDWLAKHYQEQTDKLTALGLVDLTEEQKEVITMPNEAPENYMCDGEISPRQAQARWLFNLEETGLTPQQIKLAVKFIFG